MRTLLLPLALWTTAGLAADWAPDKFLLKAIEASTAAGPPPSAALSTEAGHLSHGGELYAARCVPCHGEAGDGNGPAAAALTPGPADFTDSDRWAKTSVGTKIWIVQNGIKGTGMAPTGLTEADARDVLSYVSATFEGRTGG